MEGQDMRGRVCLITGANSGIGKETALGLARLGAEVVMLCRDRGRGGTAMREITADSGNRSISLLLADLSSQKEIRRVAEEFRSSHDRLHVLLNNAAIVPRKRTLTVDGLEMQFAVNHIAYFLLTHLLLDTLKASAPARIINTSSGIHKRGPLNLEDLQAAKGYKAFRQYGHTKLMNLYFTYELARRLKGTGVTVNAFTPSFNATGLGREFSAGMRLGMKLFGSHPRKGARTAIHLANSPEVEGVAGGYFVRSKAVRSSDVSYDEAIGRRLWEVTERVVGPVDGEG